MAESGELRPGNRGWRRLAMFWVTTLLLIFIGAATLQFLGPPAETAMRVAIAEPPAQPAVAVGPAPAPAVAVMTAPAVAVRPAPAVSVMTAPGVSVRTAPAVAPDVGRDTPGPVADPDPTMMEPVNAGSKDLLPRIAPDGRAAMRVYAAGFDHSSRRPRVGLVLAGIGLIEAESAEAIRELPGAVTLAISPYAANTAKLLTSARIAGHEYLIAIPMEPPGFPLNDPGPHALLTSLSPEENIVHLRWALSRIPGYIGAIGVTGTMRGERLARMTDQMDAVLSELADRGLLYIDPREGRGPAGRAWGRHADVVIDDPAERPVIEARLNELEQLARDHGTALGLVMRPTPVAVARIAAWTNGLAARGLALAPVSALVLPPEEARMNVTVRAE